MRSVNGSKRASNEASSAAAPAAASIELVDSQPGVPSTPDPVPARLLGLLELFSAELEGVSFPDLDAALLEEVAGAVRTQSAEVATAREALERAKATLAETHATLERHADRAIAYARIFADGNEGLLARLDDLSAVPAKKGDKGRGRSKDATPRKTRKSKAGGPELPFGREPAPLAPELSESESEEALAAAS